MAIPSPVLVMDLVTKMPSGEYRNRFYFEATIYPTTIPQLEACCNRVMSVYTTLLSALCTTQVSFTKVEGRAYGVGGTEFEANSTSPEVAGGITAVAPNSPSEDGSLPDTFGADVVLIVQKRTGKVGRQKRGRWFFCGLSEQLANNGLIIDDVLVNVKGLADGLSNTVTVTSGFSTVLNPRHWDRKGNTLEPITKCYAIRNLGSRDDRRLKPRLVRA